MNEYEVKVTPTLEVDMDKLKSDVRNLSSMINKSATGKIKFHADTTVAQKQINEFANTPQVVKIGVKAEPRSMKEVETEIRQRLKKIEQLSDVSGNLDAVGGKKTVTEFKQHIQALVETRLEYEKLARIQSEYSEAFVNQQNKLAREDRFLAMQLKNLKDFRQSSAEEIQEVIEVFRQIHKMDAAIPPIDLLLNIDESQAITLVKEALSGIQRLDTTVGMDVNVAEESIRKVEATIADVQKQLKGISEVVVPMVVSRDMQGAGAQRAKELGHEIENLDQAKYAKDVIEAYNKRLALIEEAVHSTQRLHEVSQEAVNNNQELLSELANVVGQLEAQMNRATSQIEHYQAQLESVATSSEALQIAQSAASDNTVVLPVEIDADKAISSIVAMGEEAKRKLAALGPEKFTKSELHMEALHSGMSPEETRAFIEQRKAEGAYSEKLSKKLKSERAEREELNRIIQESQRVQSDEIQYMDWDTLKTVGVQPKDFAEYMRSIKDLKHQAQAAEQELLNLANGLKKYSMAHESTVVDRSPIQSPKGATFAEPQFEETRRQQVETMTAYARSIQELEEQWFGVLQNRHDYDPSTVKVQEVAVTQEHIDRLTAAVNQYNAALQDAGSCVTQAFGAIELPTLDASLVVNAPQIQQEIKSAVGEAQEAADAVPIEITFAQIDDKVQELTALQDALSELRRELDSARNVKDINQQALHDPAAIEKLRQSYESQGVFVADTQEQLDNFVAEKTQAMLGFSDAIETVKQSIFALGAGSGDVPAAIDFIAEAVGNAKQPIIDFSSLQQRSTEEIVENLQTVIDAYKNFTIPDPHAGRSSKAFKEAARENLAYKDTSGRWQVKDDETIGRKTLQKLEQQKSMLSQAQRLAQEYHEALNGDESQLGKPILNFLDSIQERLHTNAEAADTLRKKLKIDDNAVAVGMSQHLGEQIRELNNTVRTGENPFEAYSDEWFEEQKRQLAQLIALTHQYEAVLTKLNSSGFLPDSEIPGVHGLEKELRKVEEEQLRVQQSRVDVSVEADLSEVKNISGKVQDKINEQPVAIIPVEPSVNATDEIPPIEIPVSVDEQQAVQIIRDTIAESADVGIEIPIKPQFDSSALSEGMGANTDAPIGTDQPPVTISGELQIDNEQVREAFETLNNAIKENKSISQEALTLTADNFEQKHDAIVAVQSALEKLIGLYHEFQEASTGGVGLSDADIAFPLSIVVIAAMHKPPQ